MATVSSSDVARMMRASLNRRLADFAKHYTGDKVERKAKLRYLDALQAGHFHSFAITRTRGVGEWVFRRWLREDDAFMESCNVVRLSFIDRLEYAVLCRGGFYGSEKYQKYKAIDTKGMCDFIRIARYNGIYRRLAADGGPGKTGKAGGVSRDGEGAGCSIVEEGREGDLCSLPAAAAVPQG